MEAPSPFAPELYHTEELAPIFTSPTTEADGATKAVGAQVGILPPTATSRAEGTNVST